ncbi:CENP-B protein, partial [Aureobasidium melanogenum]
MAISIQRAAGSEAGLGRKWLYKFLEKYSTCGSLLGDPHEALRVNEATEENVRAWFGLFSSYRDQYRVLDCNIWKLDEHGLCIGKINPRKVVGATKDKWGKLRKRTKMRNPETREWVSIVECISAGQTFTQPLIIFEGVNVNIDWLPDVLPPYKYTADPTVSINDKIAIAWINERFVPQTRPRGVHYRILLFDQHATHLSDKFEQACKKRRTITLPLPAHTSDILQPCDLTMFSPIKGKYKDKLYELCQLNDSEPTKKKDFCRLYHEARKETFKPSNYETAFKKAGLVPFDPQSVINRPEVIKQPPQPREPQPDDLPPCIYDAKALEKDLYHLDKERGACDTHGED